MHRTTKLVSGVALLISLSTHAFAGTLDQLLAQTPKGTEVKIEAPVPAKAAPEYNYGGFNYLTGVGQVHIREFVSDLFSDSRVMVVNIALDPVLKLPSRPIVSYMSSYSYGFTVGCSGVIADVPGANWETLREYRAIEAELPAAISFIMEDGGLEHNLLEITKQDGHFTLKVKANPWK